MSIGEIIYIRRKALNMTQKDLAQKLNITDRTVSRWERGNSLPDVAMLKTLAEVLNMDVGEFYSDVPTNEINKDETVDYERIDRYKRGLIIPFLFLVASLIALPVIKLNYRDICDMPMIQVYNPEHNAYMTELYRKTCIGCVFALCGFVCSLTCMTYEFISFRNFYIRKSSWKIYSDLSRRVNIAYIVLSVIFVILFMIDPYSLWMIVNGRTISWDNFLWKLL